MWRISVINTTNNDVHILPYAATASLYYSEKEYGHYVVRLIFNNTWYRKPKNGSQNMHKSIQYTW